MRAASGIPKRLAPAKPLLWKAPAATYIICTNPRSGSWLLSEGLSSTGLAGNPREWFNMGEEQAHRARWRMEHSADLSFATYFEIARAESTTANGISGLKLHYFQLAELSTRMTAWDGFGALSAAELLPKVFPDARYIWLTRRDKARQAISLLMATSTDEWWNIEGANDAPSENAGEPEYDPLTLARMELGLANNDARWRSFFEGNRVQPLVIHYEDLVADYAGTIVNVLRWLGVREADSIAVPPTRLRRQSNARNEDWLTRYNAFKSEGGHLAITNQSSPGRFPRPAKTIPSAWKEWIGQSKLLGTKDDSIVDVLVKNGYTLALAWAEVQKAGSDPYLIGAARAGRQWKKGASLLGTLGKLTGLDSRLHPVERRSDLSRDEFRDHYYAANRPVILTGLLSGWRAMTAWTPSYFKSLAGNQTVEVMTGRDTNPKYERNGRAHRRNLRFADYIDMVYSGKVTNDYYLVANNAFFQKPEMRPLLNDFTAFPQYLNPSAGPRQCFFWFGPAGTITPLHRDTSNILLAQVTGRKRYRMIPSSQWQCVYNRDGVFSEVDCENPDLDRYPNFRDASISDIVVEPGEVLFMPVGWWHHVRALDVSMTISFTNFVFPNYFLEGQ